MENLGIFYDHLVYFRALGNILWPFGIFSPLWYFAPRKIWQPSRTDCFSRIDSYERKGDVESFD
jgi:hypothetical protein